MKPKTPAKGVKRQRSASPSPSSKASSQSIPTETPSATPSRPVKKAKVQKASSSKAEESATKAIEETALSPEKATKAKATDTDKATKAEAAQAEKSRKAEATKAAKALKAEAAALEKSRKANVKQWKQDWKSWFTAIANQTSATFQRTPDDDLVNVKESNTIYGVKREELNCLRHCNAANPHGAQFTPMKLFVKAEVQDLAFRKEAVLAGISQDDEAEVLRRGKELFEEKFGPLDELWASNMGDAAPAKDRKPDHKTISGYHWQLIRQLKAGQLFDDRVLDALDELEEAGLRHMVD